jgi:formate hydrogenlyase subunit 4
MRGRYSMPDHVITRLVGVLFVAGALGPWTQGTDLVPDSTILEAVSITFGVGCLLLGAVEGIAAMIRLFVVPRGPEDPPR